MVHNSTLAEVHWEPVSLPSVRGKLQGYKVWLPLNSLPCLKQHTIEQQENKESLFEPPTRDNTFIPLNRKP